MVDTATVPLRSRYGLRVPSQRVEEPLVLVDVDA